ncbi:MAG: hypothetical protein RSE12_20310 [Fuscovulum sp.]|jgi:hypothetical protein|nr:hypothetical protein [Paracoccaceae bacterium]MCZ8084691.1 hypothetical protein [Paracoccaceae bacterium]WRH62666.1 MAG: hypothetical protein RSE12_20310 [Fuscovulum sp.]
MMKVLAVTMLKKTAEPTVVTGPQILGRAELEDLFQDDFAAHAMLIKSRKAARAAQGRLAA